MPIVIHTSNLNTKAAQNLGALLEDEYPRCEHLTEVLRDRLPTLETEFSRCYHMKRFSSDDEETGVRSWLNSRSDASPFQHKHVQERLRGSSETENGKREMETRYLNMCKFVRERFKVYGYLGAGTHGTIFAARQRLPSSAGHGFKQYALKVEEHETLRQSHGTHRYARMVGMIQGDPESGKTRYVPEEAVFMLLVHKCPRFPAIDSVYVDGQYYTLVMESALDADPDMDAEPATDYQERYRPHIGERMIHKKQTPLSEIQVCKIASQMLEAMAYLRDMGMLHDDLGHRNYAILENLDLKVLDLGLMNLYTNDEEWQLLEWVYTAYMEYLMSPEVAVELSKSYYEEKSVSGDQMNVYYPHDHRITDQWKFACITFELLHGFAPWEDPNWDEEVQGIRDWNRTSVSDRVRMKKIKKVLLRRGRMINEELPINDGLSQDCVDWLRAMLHRDPDQRPDVSLKEASSFAWFQGQWVNQGPFKRPSWADDGNLTFPLDANDYMDLTGA